MCKIDTPCILPVNLVPAAKETPTSERIPLFLSQLWIPMKIHKFESVHQWQKTWIISFSLPPPTLPSSSSLFSSSFLFLIYKT